MPRDIVGEAGWLQSDGQILGRLRQTRTPDGIVLELEMPMGDPVRAQVEKWPNAQIAASFCELARDIYVERKTKQEAQQERASAVAQAKLAAEREQQENVTSYDIIPPAEETPEKIVQIDFSSREAVAAELDRTLNRLTTLWDEIHLLTKQRDKLVKIVEVLSAFEDDEETVRSVPTKTPPRTEAQGGVDRESCDREVYTGGAPVTSSDGEAQALDFTPNAETNTGQNDGLHQEANVDAGSSESLDSDTDSL